MPPELSASTIEHNDLRKQFRENCNAIIQRQIPCTVKDNIEGATEFGAEIDRFLRQGGSVKKFPSLDILGGVHELMELEEVTEQTGFGSNTNFYFGSTLYGDTHKRY
jgi:hypothetical protein